MKMPDEIKKGLEMHSKDDEGCYGQQCPFFNVGLGKFCTEVMAEEALTLIQQLEQQTTEQAARLEQVTRERDAAISDIESYQGLICQVCKHYYRPDPNIRRWTCRIYGNDWPEVSEDGILVCGLFKWRGVLKENKNENT